MKRALVAAGALMALDLLAGQDGVPWLGAITVVAVIAYLAGHHRRAGGQHNSPPYGQPPATAGTRTPRGQANTPGRQQAPATGRRGATQARKSPSRRARIAHDVLRLVITR